MIRKRSKNPSVPVSISQALGSLDAPEQPIQSHTAFSLKRVKPGDLAQSQISGFSQVDASKIDISFLKAKINQVLKSFENNKPKEQMRQQDKNAESQKPTPKAQSEAFRPGEKLDRYIARAYKKCLNPKEQAVMSNLLEQVIQDAQRTGEVGSRNWDLMPLPLLPREKQDNLSLVLNSQFLQINKGAHSTLLSAVPKPEPKNELINSLLQPKVSAPITAKEFLNSLVSGKKQEEAKEQSNKGKEFQKNEASRFQSNQHRQFSGQLGNLDFSDKKLPGQKNNLQDFNLKTKKNPTGFSKEESQEAWKKGQKGRFQAHENLEFRQTLGKFSSRA